MRILSTLAFLIATCPGIAAADTARLCSGLAAVLVDGSGNGDALRRVAPELTETPAVCGQSMGVGGAMSTHCRWAFAYRDPRAAAAYRALVTDLAHCVGPEQVTANAEDKAVNHPDTYDLRLMAITGGTAGISLKDKAALQQTLVFLRIAPQ